MLYTLIEENIQFLIQSCRSLRWVLLRSRTLYERLVDMLKWLKKIMWSKEGIRNFWNGVKANKIMFTFIIMFHVKVISIKNNSKDYIVYHLCILVCVSWSGPKTQPAPLIRVCPLSVITVVNFSRQLPLQSHH
jgi:hypothetical protein